MLEGELNTPTSSFAAFVNDSFMTSTAYGGDIYGSPSQPYSYTGKAADADTSGAEEITVTLRRRPGDGADKLNQTVNSTTATDLRNLLDTLEGEDRKGMAIVDLQLDITVTVTKNGESFAFTRTYDRTVKYSSSDKSTSKVYYTVNGRTTENYREDALTFVAAGQEKLIITDDNINSNRLTFHCDTSQQPDSITYTRGAKQSTGTTQE